MKVLEFFYIMIFIFKSEILHRVSIMASRVSKQTPAIGLCKAGRRLRP